MCEGNHQAGSYYIVIRHAVSGFVIEEHSEEGVEYHTVSVKEDSDCDMEDFIELVWVLRDILGAFGNKHTGHRLVLGCEHNDLIQDEGKLKEAIRGIFYNTTDNDCTRFIDFDTISKTFNEVLLEEKADESK